MTDNNKNKSAPIESYALIGDCETAALSIRQGSIDWLCWPDFSSDACFAALLGTEENGYWRIGPANDKWQMENHPPLSRPHADSRNHFRNRSSALIPPHRFHASPPANSEIVRIVEGIRGNVDVRMELSLRFDYGRTVPWVTQHQKRRSRYRRPQSRRASRLRPRSAAKT